MKILFVSCAYPPLYTGIGAYTANMAEALSLAGHEVVVATSRIEGKSEQEETASGLILRCYSHEELRTTQLARRLLRLAVEHHADLVECADFLGEGGPLLRLQRNIPVCVKAHNSGPVRVGRDAEVLYPWQKFMQWAAILRGLRQYREERYSLEHGDLLVTPSQRLMDELVEQGFSLPAKRAVQPNPISLPKHCPERCEAENPTVLFVGRLAIGKGIAVLPPLLRRLVTWFPDIRMVIAGDDSYARGLGSLRTWLLRKFDDLATHVEFTGQLNREQLARQYREAWVVLVPSWWDTFPTVLLEAMASATPVVASPHGGMVEMLDNTLCLAVDPDSEGYAEEVKRLLDDSSLRLAAGRSLFAKARACYAPEVVGGQYGRLLSSLLATTSS